MARSDITPSFEDFRKALKDKGLKATAQRLAVHGAMMELGHASADMVHSYLKDSGGDCPSVASIYNILSQMAAIGVYKHRLSASSKMFFDVNVHKHLHLYDTVNNEYRDLLDEELTSMVEKHLKSRRFKGYKIEGIDIQILCHPTHRKKSTSN